MSIRSYIWKERARDKHKWFLAFNISYIYIMIKFITVNCFFCCCCSFHNNYDICIWIFAFDAFCANKDAKFLNLSIYLWDCRCGLYILLFVSFSLTWYVIFFVFSSRYYWMCICFFMRCIKIGFVCVSVCSIVVFSPVNFIFSHKNHHHLTHNLLRFTCI